MAQLVTRCRLTGHYMFIAMEADPKDFVRAYGPFIRKFCPFCSCEHMWYREDCKFLRPKPVVRGGIQLKAVAPHWEWIAEDGMPNVASIMQQQDFWADTFKLVEHKVPQSRVIDPSIAKEASARLAAEKPFG
jgi:hypothetical protein